MYEMKNGSGIFIQYNLDCRPKISEGIDFAI